MIGRRQDKIKWVEYTPEKKKKKGRKLEVYEIKPPKNEDGKCSKCAIYALNGFDAICPFDEDVYDCTTYCFCCEYHRHECEMEI